MRALSITVLLLVPSLAGLDLADAQAEPPLTDAEGDARWYTTGDLADFARTGCYLAGPAAKACAQAPTIPSEGGTPAPGVLDIVAGDLRIVDGNVVGELRVATLTDPVEALGFGGEIIVYSLMWGVEDRFEGFGATIGRTNGSTQYDAWFSRMDERCARVSVCFFDPVFEMIPGTPGTLRWTIPHHALPADTPTEVTLTGTTLHVAGADRGSGYSYSASAREQRVAGMTPEAPFSFVDEAGPGRPTPLGPPASWDPARDRMGFQTDPSGDVPAHRDDLDLLSVTLRETPTTFGFTAQVARIDELPADHLFHAELYLTTGTFVSAGYVAQGGGRASYGGTCGDSCLPADVIPFQRPVEVVVTPGEPGLINVTFPRSALGNPGWGDTFNQFFLGMFPPDAYLQEDAPLGKVRRLDRGAADFIWDAAPWWFTLGEDRLPAREDDVVTVLDPVGDLPGGLTLSGITGDLGAFDIVSIRATGASPGIFRVELAIDDLSTIAPPQGYRAVFYGVAFAANEGPIMAGYYSEPAIEKRQFFCAPDTAVIVHPASDPNKVIWQPIQGLLSVVRERGEQVAGRATPGSIVFLIPSSCFGVGDTDDLAVESLAAATFLLNDIGDMEMVDEARSEGPVVLRAAQPPAPAWYAQPFGVDNFWDITGVILAILVSLIGLLVVARKRGALRRYLHDIDRALHEHAADARARERALAAIQTRVKADLLRNRITESHFVIVERRLDAHLSKLRVHALGDAFGDIPHRLLVTLQDLLRDGVMDREDWQLFRTQLAAEPHLTTDSRAAIERRVEAWVRDELHAA